MVKPTYWTGLAGNGLYGDGGNWEGDAVPGPNAFAIINIQNDPRPYTVTLLPGESFDLFSLRVQGGAAGSRETLVVGGSLTVSSTIALQNTNLDVSGLLASNGAPFNIYPAALVLGYQVTVNDTGAFTVAGNMISNGQKDVFNVTGGKFLAHSALDGVGTTWNLKSAGTIGFSGLVSGSGDSFEFKDSTADILTLGAQGSSLGGAVGGFGLHNAIDLTGIAIAGDDFSAAVSGSELLIERSGSTVFTFDNFAFASGYDASDIRFTADSGTGTLLTVTCFLAGTRILTAGGEVAVEALREGDRVATLVDGATVLRPVVWLGRRRIDLARHPRADLARPIRIRRDAFAPGAPERDLLVSPDHAILVDGGLIPARLLVNDATIAPDASLPVVEYFHVELDRHAVILAEGLAVESYLDTGNRAVFDNAGEATLLHPEFHVNAGLKQWTADACAPLVVDAAAVEPAWRALASRAVTLGYILPDAATTTDPDLRLVVQGRTIRPAVDSDGRYVFALPAGSTGGRLLSRAGAPSAVRPWLDDGRRLGVAVSRIVLRGHGATEELAVDHPALSDGWLASEGDGATLWRWTDGAALLAWSEAAQALEIQVGGSQTYLLAADEPAPDIRRSA